MPRILLMGNAQAGQGKVAFVLTGEASTSQRASQGASLRAMALSYCGPFVITPSEFLENRRFYHALIAEAARCSAVFMLQNALSSTSPYPPGFARMFNRPVVGVVPHALSPNANPELAARFLRLAGARRIEQICVACPETLASLREFLE